jgi:hypothetical protein
MIKKIAIALAPSRRFAPLSLCVQRRSESYRAALRATDRAKKEARSVREEINRDIQFWILDFGFWINERIE